AGTVIGFTRDYLENAVFSSVYNYDIRGILEKNPKKEIKETDILPNQIYESITVKEDKVVEITLAENRNYVLNDWLIDHLTNEDTFYDWNEGYKKITDYNMGIIESRCSKYLPDGSKYPMLKTGDKTVRLKFTFKEGEVLDFTNPGVMSLFYDPNEIALLANSEAVLGEEKEEYFKNDFQNTFFAESGGICSSKQLFRYYRVNDDVNEEYAWHLGGADANAAEKDENGFIRVAYLKLDSYDENQFKRSDVLGLSKVATEIPLEEAKKIHENRLIREQEAEDKRMQEFHEQQEKHAQELEKAYEEKKDEESIFPGAGGVFAQTYESGDLNDDVEKNRKYTLEEIKEFYSKLKDINQSILDYMYFYGGTIPYILTDANTSREFGDVDIFVPVEAMRYVREELQRQPSFEVDFDSIDVTSRVNLTSRIPGEEKDDTLGLAVLGALMGIGDDETLDNMFNNRPKGTLQDFGLKGKLFGIKFSIFPIYQYDGDLMAKSFNITDMYEYLLAVRVMNNTEIKDFAKNVQICGNNLHILPIEYVIISKESAIEHDFKKRVEKDKEDLAYIEKHHDELAIDDELKEKLKENYPDYSIAMAYYVTRDGVEKIGGEKYKDLMLMNNGGWLSC
ncbi:MAG: hypothetical protein K2L98_01625, partial [Bacilli bacterium]|nr:hypothetical protein [Bacilli bacterium]